MNNNLFSNLENSPKNAEDMVNDFNLRPKFANLTRESAAMLLDMIDTNYFSKDVMTTNPEMVNIIKTLFKDRNPEMEIRLYKTQHLLYAMLKTFEDLGIITIVKEDIIKKSPEEIIKEKARIIWADFKRKHKN